MRCKKDGNQADGHTNKNAGSDITATHANIPEKNRWDYRESIALMSPELYEVYRFSSSRYDAPCPDEIDTIHVSHLNEVTKYKNGDPAKISGDEYIVLKGLRGSDYGGDSVEIANYRVFMEKFGKCAGVHPLTGDYGSYGVAIRADCFTSEMGEMLKNLEIYPILDENVLEDVEIESHEEAWDNWARDDFLRLLDNKFGEKIDVYALEEDDDNLWELFHNAVEKSNAEWIIYTGNSATIDIERVASVIGIEDLKKALKNVE